MYVYVRVCIEAVFCKFILCVHSCDPPSVVKIQNSSITRIYNRDLKKPFVLEKLKLHKSREHSVTDTICHQLTSVTPNLQLLPFPL